MNVMSMLIEMFPRKEPLSLMGITVILEIIGHV